MNKLAFSENIVTMRHKKKITQEQLADFLGVTKGSVSKWETGV
jgi:DNA-binding transcriptional regulator YiaG